MKRVRSIVKLLIGGSLFVGLLAFLLGPLAYQPEYAPDEMRYGFTYSTIYAESLGLDPVGPLKSALEELKPDLMRIPVYWNRVETEQNVFSWDEVDAQMNLAAEHEVDVILAIGRRVPRWPECFLPEWTYGMDRGSLRAAQMSMMETVVDRYKEHPALYRWQVENEPFFALFGECPPIDFAFLEREYDLMRTLDPEHEVMTTASGEQSFWRRVAGLADIVGVSVYRETYTPYLGYTTYPIPTWTYRAKASGLAVPVMISELQAEPWFARPFSTYTPQEQSELFDEEQMRDHIGYAQEIGFQEVLFWGVEWWYWMKEQGHAQYWETYQSLSL